MMEQFYAAVIGQASKIPGLADRIIGIGKEAIAQGVI